MATETDILARLRKGYTAQGFEVHIRPRIERPEGADLRPDLIARSARETVLVGVRSIAGPVGGGGAEEASRLRLLAEAAEDRPDWTFRLVLAETSSPAPDLPERGALSAKVAEARRLYRKGDQAPALLYAWSVLASAARIALAPDEDRLADLEPRALGPALVAQGLAAQDDTPWLCEAGDLVAAVLGGALDQTVDKALFDRICSHALTLSGERVPRLETTRGAQGRGLGLTYGR